MAHQTLKDAAQLAKQGKKDEATKMAMSYARENPKDADVWVLLGRLLPEDKQKIEAFERAVKLRPEDERLAAHLRKLKGEDVGADFGQLMKTTGGPEPVPQTKPSAPTKKQQNPIVVAAVVGISLVMCVACLLTSQSLSRVKVTTEAEVACIVDGGTSSQCTELLDDVEREFPDEWQYCLRRHSSIIPFMGDGYAFFNCLADEIT